MPKRYILTLYLVLSLFFLAGLRSFFVKHPVFSGSTMGTTYRVQISGYISRSTLNPLQQRIEERLEEINRQMSTWRADSEISRFNASTSTNAFPVSDAFAAVVSRALEFADVTEGTFDPTLQPLLNLWGFGSGGERSKIPTDEEIDQVMGFIGADLVWLEDGTNLWKGIDEVQLDLGAIAKGYGADAIGGLLDAIGYKNWFVEIGGEVAVRGVNPRGRPWTVGIQYPSALAPPDALYGILHLTNGTVATSGDYRNYFEEDGTYYTHIIDPWTGQSVRTNTASVTVYAPYCLDADAAATALFVLGVEDGLNWTELQPDIEALFLLRGTNGTIDVQMSSGFAAATGYEPIETAP